MKPLWLACCASEDYPRAQREIEFDGAGTQVLRLDDCSMLERVAGAFSEPPRGIVLYRRHSEPTDLEAVVARIRGAHESVRLVVILDELDVAHIARLFQAGASEVVAAHDRREGHAVPTAESTSGHAQGERPYISNCSSLYTPVEPGAPRETDGLALNAPEAAHVEAPQDQLERNGSHRDPQRDCRDGSHHDARSGSRCAQPHGESRPDASSGILSDTAVEELDEPADPPASVAAPKQSDRRAPRAPEVPDPCDQTGASAGAKRPAAGHAPVICLLSGQGGAGKTTLAAAMAWSAARLGLRAAVVDLDLMFGNLYRLVGVDAPRDLGALIASARQGGLDEESIVGASMRVAPGFTLWGPLAVPEQAELMGPAVEMLLDTLRSESDVVFVDTSTHWSDAVAAAVERCDRSLMVCDGAVGSREALGRAIKLVERLGVPRTRMTCVVNRVGPRGCEEERASGLEIEASLSSTMRIVDGGVEVGEPLRAGRMDQLMASPRPFTRSVRSATGKLLLELGCPVDRTRLHIDEEDEPRARLRLPWNKVGGA